MPARTQPTKSLFHEVSDAAQAKRARCQGNDWSYPAVRALKTHFGERAYEPISMRRNAKGEHPAKVVEAEIVRQGRNFKLGAEFWADFNYAFGVSANPVKGSATESMEECIDLVCVSLSRRPGGIPERTPGECL